jgi:hypothetical protein
MKKTPTDGSFTLSFSFVIALYYVKVFSNKKGKLVE